ncbi:MAG: M24 family metallopeptidase C-terminal domain-containing protein, partial [Lachnospira sp.]|nr:M24 family metallopeptidase C-terminal domain-containing protein [Lachnospira sp.]
VTSDEPGVYIEDEFGIRIENEIVCVKDYENEYGTFLKFDMLTKVPIDLELVDIKYLDDEDIRRLNAYHKDVYESLKDYFEGEELEFLKMATAQITR